MDTKRARKDITEFYEALNDFFDWVDERQEETEKKVDGAFGLPKGAFTTHVDSIVGKFKIEGEPIKFDALKGVEVTLVPAEKDAEIVPTLDDMADIHKAFADGTPFNVEFLTGDTLREAFIQERDFRYLGKYTISQFKAAEISKCGFEILYDGSTVRVCYLTDILYDDEELVLHPYRWDDMAQYVADEAEDYEDENKGK